MGPGRLSGKALMTGLLGLALLLPAVLAVTTPEGVARFSSLAGGSRELLLWIEPSVQVASRGQVVSFDVMAEFDDDRRVLGQLQFRVLGDAGLVIENPFVAKADSLRGRVKVGTVAVRASTSGEWKIWVDEMSVMSGYPDLPTRATGARLVVKN